MIHHPHIIHGNLECALWAHIKPLLPGLPVNPRAWDRVVFATRISGDLDRFLWPYTLYSAPPPGSLAHRAEVITTQSFLVYYGAFALRRSEHDLSIVFIGEFDKRR